MNSNQTQHISLGELAGRIQSTIESNLSADQWITAEISECKVNYSGHCYLELVERASNEPVPRAVCRGVIWARSYKIIAAYFKSQTGAELSSGMQVLVKCSVTYHPVYGLSLVISDIDPTYTLGQVERQKQMTIQRLTDEGVYDMNRQFVLPSVVQRVAVVSSEAAAGFQDFCKEIDRSRFAFEVELFAAVMQGAQAAESICEALERIEASEHDYDAVVIIRGGGSQNDLECFNDYRIALAITEMSYAVLTGIGHDKDVAVADLVANMMFKTPTAVATTMVEWGETLWQRLERASGAIETYARTVLTGESARIENLTLMLQQNSHEIAHRAEIGMRELHNALRQSLGQYTLRRTARLEWLAGQVTTIPQRVLAQQNARTEMLVERLSTSTTARLTNEARRIQMLAMGVESQNPRRILRRGYAIVRGGIRSVKELHQGDEITIELQDGLVETIVKRCQKNP